jgi:exodeoxyribonuclease V alpha subunit
MIDQALRYANSDGHTLLTKDLAVYYAKRHGLSWSARDLVASDIIKLPGEPAGYGLSTLLIPECRIARALGGRKLYNRAVPATLATPVPKPPTLNLSPEQAREWPFLASPEPGGYRVALLTGLPGTGKTFLISKLIQEWSATGLHVECCAPTGKAASVLAAKTGENVVTIHRLIGLRPGQDFAPTDLYCDVLVVDESSMLDVELFANLIECCKKVPHIVLVGDPNQIPPVGAGQPFADLVSVITPSHLTCIQRQGSDSGILSLSRDFLFGRVQDRYPNVHHFGSPSLAVELYTSGRLAKRFDLQDVRTGAIILSPVKNEKFGISTEKINYAISHALLKDRPGKFSVGDRLMFTVNDYSHGFVNGEMGTLVDYDGRTKLAKIVNDSGRMYVLEDYSIERFAQWGYALTVHKSQGSEADVVVLLLEKECAFMYNRNLMYTAMTRAKKELVVMGDWSLLVRAARRPEVRHTCLVSLLGLPDVVKRVLDKNTTPDLSAYGGGV